MSKMREYFSRKRQEARKRREEYRNSDSGADVLVVGLIVIPLIIGSVGFALDITKNIYLNNAYESMAQQAAYSAAQERNIYGQLTEDSGQAFVDEYRRQRGDDVSHDITGTSTQSTQTRETQAFRSDRCNSATAEDLGTNFDIDEFPRITISYSTGRGEFGDHTVQGPYTIEGSSGNIDMDGYSPVAVGGESLVIRADVNDVSNNFLFAIFGADCQLYTNTVSSLPVYEDEDFNVNW